MSAAARLSEDLIEQLLTRLPVKPLMRFKCVSKAWRSLISDPRFAKIQLSRAREGNATFNQRIIKSMSIQTINYEEFADSQEVYPVGPGNVPGQWSKLVGHCDGLVCLAGEGGTMIYNPTTGQSKIIPSSSLAPQTYYFQGFGYDPKTDDYKIVWGVVLTGGDVSKESEMEIFSLRSNSWRRIRNSKVIGAYDRGIYVNGALHWFVYRKKTILSFDLADEEFKEVLPMPGMDMEFEGLGVSGDRIFLYTATWKYRLEAWVMNEYGNKESWTKLFDVRTEGIPVSNYWTVPLCQTESGKIMLDHDGREMILFDPEDGTCKRYPVADVDWESAIYVESLISPNDVDVAVDCH